MCRSDDDLESRTTVADRGLHARMSRNSVGHLGEGMAAQYFAWLGFAILGRNVREGPREIDLVVQDREWLIVVEVRSRGRTDYGRAEETVDRRKRLHLLRAGRAIWEKSDRARRLRFDVIAIHVDARGLTLRHFPHIMDPDQDNIAARGR